MIKIFIKSIKNGFRFKMIGLIIYTVQLLLALTLGIQIYQVMDASIGNSAGLSNLLEQFNYTTFNDFLNVHGASISPIFGQLRYLLLVYAVFSIFLNAGSLGCIILNENSWSSFWSNAARYFFAFSKIALFFLIIFFFISALIWIPILSSFEAAMEYFYTEKPYVWILILAFPLYFLLLSFIFLWSVHSRISIIREDLNVIFGLKNGLFKTKKYFWKSLLVLFMFALVMFFGTFIYLWANKTVGMVSGWTILIFILLQQAIIYLRILWRFMIYKSIDNISEGNHEN